MADALCAELWSCVVEHLDDVDDVIRLRSVSRDARAASLDSLSARIGRDAAYFAALRVRLTPRSGARALRAYLKRDRAHPIGSWSYVCSRCGAATVELGQCRCHVARKPPVPFPWARACVGPATAVAAVALVVAVRGRR